MARDRFRRASQRTAAKKERDEDQTLHHLKDYGADKEAKRQAARATRPSRQTAEEFLQGGGRVTIVPTSLRNYPLPSRMSEGKKLRNCSGAG